MNISPVKILRKELKHLEEMKEKLDYKKKMIIEQLDDVSYDLNELCMTIEELRAAISHLDEIYKK